MIRLPSYPPMEPQIIEALDTLQLQSNWCQREGLILWTAQGQLVCCTSDLLSRSAQRSLENQIQSNWQTP